jgi:hypothetical protein
MDNLFPTFTKTLCPSVPSSSRSPESLRDSNDNHDYSFTTRRAIIFELFCQSLGQYLCQDMGRFGS